MTATYNKHQSNLYSKHYSVVWKDDNSGSGVVSHARFSVGDKIGDLGGEIVTEVCQHSLQVAPGKHIVDLDFAGYLLHACDPNVSLEVQKRAVFARKPINKGDFLTMDYAQSEDYLYRQFACHCGAENCRNWIVGRKEHTEILIGDDMGAGTRAG